MNVKTESKINLRKRISNSISKLPLYSYEISK